MKKPLFTIGFIGLGQRGRSYIDACTILERSGDVKMIGICDVIPNNLYPRLPFFADYREMLAVQKPDILFIAVPNNAQTQITYDALKRNAFVIKHAPLATSFIDGEELVAFSQQKRTTIITTHIDENPLLTKEIEKFLPNIGQPIDFSYTFTRNVETPSWFWHHDAGGGVWLNFGWHVISTIHQLLGKIIDIELQWNIGGKRNWHYDVDHSAYAQVALENGVKGKIFISCIYSPEENFKITGTKGTLIFDESKIHLINREGVQRFSFHVLEDLNQQNRRVLQVKSFIDQLCQRNYSMDKDLAVLEVLQRGIDSARSSEKGKYHE